MSQAPLKLGTFLGGALEEMFLREQTKVLENIRDPNTSPTAKRTLTIKIEYVPGKDGIRFRHTAFCDSKLAPVIEETGEGYIVREGGQLVAMENQFEQTEIETNLQAVEGSNR